MPLLHNVSVSMVREIQFWLHILVGNRALRVAVFRARVVRTTTMTRSLRHVGQIESVLPDCSRIKVTMIDSNYISSTRSALQISRRPKSSQLIIMKTIPNQ
jgi:hypothetical protein